MTEWTSIEDALPEKRAWVLVYNELHDTLYSASLVHYEIVGVLQEPRQGHFLMLL